MDRSRLESSKTTKSSSADFHLAYAKLAALPSR